VLKRDAKTIKKIKIMWTNILNLQPPKGKIVKTKIDDKNGIRNEQNLKFDGKLWWVSDGTMYVYYAPTHWWND
jgi:hypothetical protein